MDSFTLTAQLRPGIGLIDLTHLSPDCLALAADGDAIPLAHQELIDGLETLAHDPKDHLRVQAIRLMRDIAQAPETQPPLRTAFYVALMPCIRESAEIRRDIGGHLLEILRGENPPVEIMKEAIAEAGTWGGDIKEDDVLKGLMAWVRKYEEAAQRERVESEIERIKDEEKEVLVLLGKMERGAVIQLPVFYILGKKLKDPYYPDLLKPKIAEAALTFLSQKRNWEYFGAALEMLGSLEETHRLSPNQLERYGRALLTFAKEDEVGFKTDFLVSELIRLLKRGDLSPGLQRELRTYCEGLALRIYPEGPDGIPVIHLNDLVRTYWTLPGVPTPRRVKDVVEGRKEILEDFIEGEGPIKNVWDDVELFILESPKLSTAQRIQTIARLVPPGFMGEYKSLSRGILLSPDLEDALPSVVGWKTTIPLEYLSDQELFHWVSRALARHTVLETNLKRTKEEPVSPERDEKIRKMEVVIGAYENILLRISMPKSSWRDEGVGLAIITEVPPPMGEPVIYLNPA